MWRAIIVVMLAVQTSGCPGGYQLVRLSNTDAGSCQPCPAGTVSVEGDMSCQPCPSGSVAVMGGQSECLVCGLGYYSKSLTECAPCPAGTYGAVKGAAMCSPCEPGAISPTDGSVVCKKCGSGEYSSTATSCTTCPAGTKSVGTKCVSCPPGTFSPRGSSECSACPAGKHSSTYGQGSCEDCPFGTFSREGSTTCDYIPCPAHSFRSRSSCQCREGYSGILSFNEVTGQFSGNCEPCDMGFWSTDGDVCRRIMCPPNSSGHPLCRCNDGFSGYIWWSGGSYVGGCTEVGCPLNTVFANATDSPSSTPKLADAQDKTVSTVTVKNSSLCICIQGYVSVSDGTGACKACGAGYRASADGNTCEKVLCPSLSVTSSHPNCVCEEGSVGIISWRQDIQSYQGYCKPCGRGTWALQGESVCRNLECPANSIGSVNCTCRAGFEGNVVQLKGSFVGQCSKCPIGYWSSGGGRPCHKIDCPANSDDHPNCLCNPGYFGTIDWASDLGVYVGGCSECSSGFSSKRGSSLCSMTACPLYSLGHPDCRVLPGFHGNVLWNRESGEYSSNIVACAAGEFQDELDKHNCKKCGPGSVSAKGSPFCIRQECPPNSFGWPNCQCIRGYSGQIRWNDSISLFEGTCSQCPRGTTPIGEECAKIECPDLSDGYPFCTCPRGYAGQISWDPYEGRYLGECQKLSCPSSAHKWPECECLPGSAGIITWLPDQQQFTGECRPCERLQYQDESGQLACKSCSAVGFAPNSEFGATACNRVNCPENAVGHPQCACAAGMWETKITWDAFRRIYVGSCAPCDVGFWSDAGSTVCEKVDCPLNSVNHPMCECKPGYKGEISWSSGMFLGSCSSYGCPANSSALGNSRYCRCNPGFSQTSKGCTMCGNGYRWNNETGECEEAKCPQNAVIVHQDFEVQESTCACDSGYYGSLVWEPFPSQKYAGECLPCPNGLVSDIGSSECWLMDCPSDIATVNQQGKCVCADGFEGEVFIQHNRYLARCSACGKGFHSHGGQPCEKVVCPENAHGHPDCACDEGYMGEILWDSDLFYYTGQCVACGQGFTSHGSVCDVVACPSNSVGHPNCQCREMFSGAVSWGGDHWESNCTQCSQGTVAVVGSDSCTVMDCPLGSSGWPNCKCLEGYVGSLKWDILLGEFVGSCVPCNPGTYLDNGLCKNCPLGYWSRSGSSSCFVVDCPDNTNAVGGICSCKSGYGGKLTFSGGAWHGSCDRCSVGFWSSSGGEKCEVVKCPPHAIGHPSCTCSPGYAHDPMAPMWNSEIGMFNGGCKACEQGFSVKEILPGVLGCVEQPCPRGSFGFPNCSCMVGNVGDLAWSTTLAQWAGSCQRCGVGQREKNGRCVDVPCPSHSSSHPRCICDDGFTGKIAFNVSKSAFEGICRECPVGSTSIRGGACIKVACPHHAVLRNGTCECSRNYTGSVSWDNQKRSYMGSCNSKICPPSSFLNASGECICNDGFEGKPHWNETLKTWFQVCVPCKKGFSSLSGNACVPIPCPANTVGHPNCTCQAGYAGIIHWTRSQYMGSCELCPPGYWPNGDGKECIYQPCPSNALGHPNCQCRSGFQGVISWGGSSFLGTCSPCPAGYHSFIGGERCLRVDCPENSINHPRCECLANFEGSVRWDRQSGRYLGSCSPCGVGFRSQGGSSSCLPLGCPANAVGFPECVCASGFSGYIEWNEAAHSYVGTCEACPLGSVSKGAENKCEEILCPENSSRNQGVCTCNEGFYGAIEWTGWSYVGRCSPTGRGFNAHNGNVVKIGCPENALFHPTCVCRNGFAGRVEWNETSRTFVGSCRRCESGNAEVNDVCVPVGCNVVGSTGFPCRCGDGWFGSVSWNEYEGIWRGECNRCPVGFSSAESTREFGFNVITTKCTYIPCPANSERHPYCSCSRGYGGAIIWDGVQYNGECVEITSESPLPSTTPTASPSISLSASVTPTISPSPSASPAPSPTPCSDQVFIDESQAFGLYRICERDPNGRPVKFCQGDWSITFFSGGIVSGPEWRLLKGMQTRFRARGALTASFPSIEWVGYAPDGQTQLPPPKMNCVSRYTPGCCVHYRYDETDTPCCFDYTSDALPEMCNVTAVAAFNREAAEHFPLMSCVAAQDIMLSRQTPETQPTEPTTTGNSGGEVLVSSFTLSPSPSPSIFPQLPPEGSQSVVMSCIVQTPQTKEEFMQNGELRSVFTEAIGDAANVPSNRVHILSVDIVIIASPTPSSSPSSKRGDIITAVQISNSLDAAASVRPYLNVTIRVLTRLQAVTNDLLQLIRQPEIFDQHVQQLCRDYKCKYPMYIMDVVDDRLEAVSTSTTTSSSLQYSVNSDCSRYSGFSVELCEVHSGCTCQQQSERSGFVMCITCKGTNIIGIQSRKFHGDDYDTADLMTREERALLGRWRREHPFAKWTAPASADAGVGMAPGAPASEHNEADTYAVMAPPRLDKDVTVPEGAFDQNLVRQNLTDMNGNGLNVANPCNETQ